MNALYDKCLQNRIFNQVTANLNNQQICAFPSLNSLIRSYILQIAIIAHKEMKANLACISYS
jgi:hypothetical protein